MQAQNLFELALFLIPSKEEFTQIIFLNVFR